MGTVVGYLNGVELRSGTAHDPATGQFTSSGSSSKLDAISHIFAGDSHLVAGAKVVVGAHKDDHKLQKFVGGLTHADLSKAFSVKGLEARHLETRSYNERGKKGTITKFSLHDSTGNPIGIVSRSFTVDSKGNRVVEHDKVDLDKKFQGNGTAKALLKNSVELYKKHGIEQIKLAAGLDAGRYVWAHMGFVAQPAEVGKYKKALQLAHPEHAAQVAKLKTIQDVAEFKVGTDHIGKQFLLSVRHIDPWHGVMELRDGHPPYEHFKKKIGL